ncbi:MAG: Lrp/AsnC family transcriptional regulator [Rudaea sp.]|uniref:Lrp/AsnC family transcriptional regulator n=1 Tax=unclassified Rudaea TaxID=2627037 RepID=UPI0014851446|nr:MULTISPECIES: Lrp/AsnC family transcriptional regulator [unclassified Rudaea]MBN8886426.1 Lrp/AsnC family transcriptional regulator [Rudaea sp.]MBR0346893.1 Lrp/AsnC family transcriptional regulator [Rudaea sp.]
MRNSLHPTQRLDHFDIAILETLQNDAAVSFAQLGERVNLSPSAVQRRVQALKADGVITGTRAILDPRKIGQALTIILEITLESDRTDLLAQIRRRLIAAAEVQHCYYVTGEYDLVVVLTLADIQALKHFVARMLAVDDNVRRYKTSVVMESIKSTTAYPLDVAV